LNQNGGRKVKRSEKILPTALAVAMATAMCSASLNLARAENAHWEKLANLPFPENYPTQKTADILHDEMLFQRAAQLVNWSLPAMVLWAMKKGSEAQFGKGSNVFPIWKDRLSAETLVSTPNSDLIYGMGYLDLKKDGPTVIEAPAKLQGILDDFWHRPLTDVGYVGPDKGKGGKYLILPPGFKGEVPEDYFTFKSRTYNVFVFWRAFRGEKDNTEAVSLMEKTRIYPLKMKDNPPMMVFPNGSRQPADMLITTDYSYFEALAEFVQNEAVDAEDWSVRGMMASLGIIKGKPFKPDERMKKILSAGAKVGHNMAQAARFGDKLPNTRYYRDRQWHNVLNVLDVEFKRDSYLDLDARMGMFKIGYSISAAMVLNMVEKGSKYPFAYKDSDGNHLSGGSSYKLRLPANVPAANFWSVTLYDAENASGLQNGQPFPSIGSLDNLKYNDDKSVDLYFGPKLPDGAPKSNYLRTVPGKGWFTLLRLYSPKKAFFDQTWRPGDFEKIK
jgi:hypothetical protein